MCVCTYKGCKISGFHREVNENCAILGYYAVSSGNILPTVRDNLPLKMGPTRGLITQKSAVLIYRVLHAAEYSFNYGYAGHVAVTGENNHSDVMKHLRYSMLQSVVTPLISVKLPFETFQISRRVYSVQL